MDESGGSADTGSDVPDDLVFDEAFVRGASVRELTAEDRARRARQLAEQQAALEEQGQVLRAARRRSRRERRPHRRLLTVLRRPGRMKGLVLVALFLGLVGWLWTTDEAQQEIAFEGWEDAPPAVELADTDRPTPAPAKTTTRLATLPRPVEPAGPYRFLWTQTGTNAPVTYDPCRPIQVVVNTRTQPAAAAGLVEDALELLGKLSGMQFVVEATTDEAPSDDRLDYQLGRYGDRWAPVLVAWSDAEESPRLEEAAGYAGSTYVELDDGTLTYVTGSVVLDGPGMAEYLEVSEPDFDGRATATDLVLHELGHLIGLDHVDDEDQVMFPEWRDGAVGLGAGDLAGLRALGQGACVPSL